MSGKKTAELICNRILPFSELKITPRGGPGDFFFKERRSDYEYREHIEFPKLQARDAVRAIREHNDRYFEALVDSLCEELRKTLEEQ